MIDFEKIIKIFEDTKLTIDIKDAKQLFDNSVKVLKSNNRYAFIQQIQKIIEAYKAEINTAGFFDKICVVYNVNYNELTDREIGNQLTYLTKNIPVYECLKQGKEKMAKEIVKQIIGDKQI